MDFNFECKQLEQGKYYFLSHFFHQSIVAQDLSTSPNAIVKILLLLSGIIELMLYKEAARHIHLLLLSLHIATTAIILCCF